MPYPRYDHVAAYDPVGDRMVVFGGTAPGPDGDSNEVWSLPLGDPSRWEWLGYTGTSPLARSGAVAVYDPAGHRMVMFGGEIDGVSLEDTWELNLTTDIWGGAGWAGTPPGYGYFLSGALDALRGRMLVIQQGQMYQLDLATNAWSTFATAGTFPTGGTGGPNPFPLAYDVPRDRLILRSSDGTWELTLSGTPTWSQLAPAGTPPPDAEGDLFYDAPRDRMLQVRGDGMVWALSLGVTPTWSSIASPPLPTGIHRAQIVHDSPRDRLIFFGSNGGGLTNANDTWAFHLASATWSLLHPGSPIPFFSRPRAAVARPWDALVIPGATTWRLQLNGGSPFQPVATSGTPPPGVSASIYDPLRQRMVVLSGSQVHALSIGPSPTWSQLAPTGTPPPARNAPHAIYDPIRDRMVVFGGDVNDVPLQDTWALTLSGTPAWSQLSLDSALPTLQTNCAVYDSRRDRLIAIGLNGGLTRAHWMPLDAPGTWTEFGGTVPGRIFFTAEYDSAADRVMLHGGVNESFTNVQDQLWSMSPGGHWSDASVSPKPLPRFQHALIRDPERDRLVLFGGLETGEFFTSPYSAWSSPAVWFTSPLGVVGVDPPTSTRGAALAFRRLWLAAPDRIAFEVDGLRAGTARVEAFDVAGRRLGAATVTSGVAGAGSGTIALGAAARSGIVLVRVRQDGLVAVRRLAMIR